MCKPHIRMCRGWYECVSYGRRGPFIVEVGYGRTMEAAYRSWWSIPLLRAAYA